jgi:very-short-patch-repair endonuclease
MGEAMLRRFARDQWVRVHGTPRITVLVGNKQARTLWLQWLSVGELDGRLVEGALETSVREAVESAIANPQRPIALLASSVALRRWRDGRRDRLAAMVDEGLIEVADKERSRPAKTKAPARNIDARSAAEAALYEALQETASTRGRFELNGYISARFGSNAAEVDLLARQDRIAIEIDGYHHFTSADGYRRDRHKDLLLQTQGFVVIRVLAQDVMRDARPAIHMVSQALAYRLGERT